MKILPFAAIALLLAACKPATKFVIEATAEGNAAPARTDGHYVLFVSSDGMRPDAVTALGSEKTPSLHRLRSEGAFTDNARTDAVYTVTLPNHTGMISSRGVVGDAGHNWIANSDPKLGQNLHRNKKGYVAGMFDVAHDNGLGTALFASKTKFSLYDESYSERFGQPDTTAEDNGRDKIDTFVMKEDTDALVDDLIEQLQSDPPRLTMLHLRDPDTAGHAHGWIIEGETPYLKAVQHVDSLIGRLLDTIEASDVLRGNTWIVVTADHGGLTNTKGHGEGKEVDNFTIPFYVWGPGVAKGADLYDLNATARTDPGRSNPDYKAAEQPIRNADAGNLILSLLGLPPIPGSTVNTAQDLKVTP